MADILKKTDMGRRSFLKKTGWLAGGLTVLGGCSGLLPPLPSSDMSEEGDEALWLQLRPDGQVHFLCPRMEMGQGVTRGLSRIVADELKLPRNQIICQLARTDQLPPYRMTVGSEGIRNLARPVRQAASALLAELRQRAEMLLIGNGESLNHVEGGFETASGLRVSYADLLTAEERDGGSEKEDAAGRSLDQTEMDIVTGRMRYARDQSMPGMLHARIIRSIGEVSSDHWQEWKLDLPEEVTGLVLPDGKRLGLIGEDLLACWSKQQTDCGTRRMNLSV